MPFHTAFLTFKDFAFVSALGGYGLILCFGHHLCEKVRDDFFLLIIKDKLGVKDKHMSGAS